MLAALDVFHSEFGAAGSDSTAETLAKVQTALRPCKVPNPKTLARELNRAADVADCLVSACNAAATDASDSGSGDLRSTLLLCGRCDGLAQCASAFATLIAETLSCGPRHPIHGVCLRLLGSAVRLWSIAAAALDPLADAIQESGAACGVSLVCRSSDSEVDFVVAASADHPAATWSPGPMLAVALRTAELLGLLGRHRYQAAVYAAAAHVSGVVSEATFAIRGPMPTDSGSQSSRASEGGGSEAPNNPMERAVECAVVALCGVARGQHQLGLSRLAELALDQAEAGHSDRDGVDDVTVRHVSQHELGLARASMAYGEGRDNRWPVAGCVDSAATHTPGSGRAVAALCSAGLAHVSFHAGRPQDALRHATDATRLWSVAHYQGRMEGSRPGVGLPGSPWREVAALADALHQTGRLWELRGDHRRAVHYYQRGLSLANKLPGEALKRRFEVLRARVATRRHHWEEADGLLNVSTADGGGGGATSAAGASADAAAAGDSVQVPVMTLISSGDLQLCRGREQSALDAFMAAHSMLLGKLSVTWEHGGKAAVDVGVVATGGAFAGDNGEVPGSAPGGSTSLAPADAVPLIRLLARVLSRVARVLHVRQHRQFVATGACDDAHEALRLYRAVMAGCGGPLLVHTPTGAGPALSATAGGSDLVQEVPEGVWPSLSPLGRVVWHLGFGRACLDWARCDGSVDAAWSGSAPAVSSDGACSGDELRPVATLEAARWHLERALSIAQPFQVTHLTRKIARELVVAMGPGACNPVGTAVHSQRTQMFGRLAATFGAGADLDMARVLRKRMGADEWARDSLPARLLDLFESGVGAAGAVASRQATLDALDTLPVDWSLGFVCHLPQSSEFLVMRLLPRGPRASCDACSPPCDRVMAAAMVRVPLAASSASTLGRLNTRLKAVSSAEVDVPTAGAAAMEVLQHTFAQVIAQSFAGAPKDLSKAATWTKEQKEAWWKERAVLDGKLRMWLADLQDVALGPYRVLLLGSVRDSDDSAPPACRRIKDTMSAARALRDLCEECGVSMAGQDVDADLLRVVASCAPGELSLQEAGVVAGVAAGVWAAPPPDVSSFDAPLSPLVEGCGSTQAASIRAAVMALAQAVLGCDGNACEPSCAGVAEPASASSAGPSADAQDDAPPSVTEQDIRGMKVVQLKRVGKEFGLEVGKLRKAALVTLLVSHVESIRKRHAAADAVVTDECKTNAGSAAAVDRRPVILLLSEDLQHMPWESMPCLRSSLVSRMPSLAFVLARSIAASDARTLLNGHSDHGDVPFVESGAWMGDLAPEAVGGVSGVEMARSGLHMGRMCAYGAHAALGRYIVDPGANLARTQATLKPAVRCLKSECVVGVGVALC